MASKIIKNQYFPAALVILDGYGLAPSGAGNAVRLANTPFLNKIFSSYPYTELRAAGESVGLFPGATGNSEAGHLNLGAGRVVWQDLVSISHSIEDGTFFKNAAFLEAIKHTKKNRSNLHIMGLLTGKNSAHAYPDHLDALIRLTREQGVKKVYFHLFTDGRDADKYESYNLLKNILAKLDSSKELVATIMGRFYGMDRKKEWKRTELAYNCLIDGGARQCEGPLRAIEEAYSRGESDEFISPTIITQKGRPLPRIDDNDSVIFFNARSDRARQLTKAFAQKKFNDDNLGSFKRKKVIKNLIFIAMTDFGPDLPGILTAFPSPDVKNTLPMTLRHLRQLYIAETDKYGHMTYFFNGGYASPVGGENRILINSPAVDSYDQTPEMSVGEITSVVIKSVEKKIYDFFGINFANPDMLGHTGNLSATIKGIEFMDKCVKKITETLVYKNNGLLFLVADHGNAEEMIDIKTGKVDTKHSVNPVPFCIVGPKKRISFIKKLRPGGALSDVAPTILFLLKQDKPGDMTGKNLVVS
ncbi:2,3-bisphosphoglycerate-independent phosphoglycerate mutase [Candidatus Kuenenbacteria bacterium]|nr:2,3-bisphosphoglycerate-independent phosphoglycerate mutase [Candidatus Kuenenbacteria bacterium]